jgi:hypothetical protein
LRKIGLCGSGLGPRSHARNPNSGAPAPIDWGEWVAAEVGTFRQSRLPALSAGAG